jgi:hypothetical protein
MPLDCCNLAIGMFRCQDNRQADYNYKLLAKDSQGKYKGYLPA